MRNFDYMIDEVDDNNIDNTEYMNGSSSHAILKKQISPFVSKKYRKTIKRLKMLIDLNNKKIPDNKYHIRIIIHATSDAEEQYALLRLTYKMAGFKLPKEKKHRWVSEKERNQIITMFFKYKLSKSEIARRLNRPVSTIYYVIRDYCYKGIKGGDYEESICML